MKRHVLTILLSLPVFSLADSPVEAAGSVQHGPINEISGIIKSRAFDGVYWVHNDSGDSARLFAITQQGDVIYPSYLDRVTVGPGHDEDHWAGLRIDLAANFDWEDIAIADGKLYIADLGNNANSRRDMGIYVVNEPNPRVVTSSRTLNFLPARFEDQNKFPAEKWHFDSESLFIDGEELYVITKHRQPGKISDWERGANLYRLKGRNTNVENTLVKVDANPKVTLATGADLSPNGQFLAVLCYEELWVFQRPADGDAWLSSKAWRTPLDFNLTGQVEAIAWIDDDSLIFTNEPGGLFRINRVDIPLVQNEGN